MTQIFRIALRSRGRIEPLLDAIEFGSLEDAYLDACATIPDMMAKLLNARRDPAGCAFLISEQDGSVLLEVPVGDLLPFGHAPGPATVAPPVDLRACRSQILISESRALRERALRLRTEAEQVIERSRLLHLECAQRRERLGTMATAGAAY